MNNPSTLVFKCFVLILNVFVAGMSGCASEASKNTETFDAGAVKAIRLNIDAIDQSSITIAKPTQEIIAEVSKNLLGWGYPIETTLNKVHSHNLIVRVDAVKHRETPTGFSFSAGNSDPRAIDFQKADVLPVSCQLISATIPEQATELVLGFTSTDNVLKTPGSATRFAINPATLVDHISTVCFNLLNELNWPKRDREQFVPLAKPNWMPEVRIETIPDGENQMDPAAAPANADNKSPKESRKVIILHNQGSPVILKFGHERK